MSDATRWAEAISGPKEQVGRCGQQHQQQQDCNSPIRCIGGSSRPTFRCSWGFAAEWCLPRRAETKGWFVPGVVFAKECEFRLASPGVGWWGVVVACGTWGKEGRGGEGGDRDRQMNRQVIAGAIVKTTLYYPEKPRERNSGEILRWHGRKMRRKNGEIFRRFSSFNFQEKWAQEISRKIGDKFGWLGNRVLSPRDSGSLGAQLFSELAGWKNKKDSLKRKFWGRIFLASGPTRWNIPDPGSGMSRTKTLCKAPLFVVLDREWPGCPAIPGSEKLDATAIAI